MKAKTFIRNLSQCIFDEYKQEIPIQELRSSFVEAIKSISPGELQDKLNNNFDKNLKKLEKNLKSLCVRELPSVSNVVDDSLEELTKSELDGRTDVEEHSTKHSNRLVYDVMKKELKKPDVEAMKNMDESQRCTIYRTFIQKVLNRDDLPETFLDTVLKEFDDVCEISKNKKSGKSKFDWLPLCELLLQLVTGSRPIAFIRVLKILCNAIQDDVNKCIASQKISRTGKLCKIMKRFLSLFHLGVGLKKMTESETKLYCRYMSGLLSFYVDLCCACSSTVVDKKKFGRELVGYVCLLLQPWPESLLDVGLQVQAMEDENCKLLLPLINKCLETKPVERRGNVYYLKYVLLVRKVKDAYLEVEDIQDWNLATKTVPARTDFLDWLDKECPEAMEFIPKEDKKFRKIKITRFLLEEAEDGLITVLVDSLSKDDKDVDSANKVEQETDATMDLENLFYLDTGGEQDADANTDETKSKRGPIVLTTLEEVEQLVDADVEDYGDNSPQTYKLDPRFVMEKVIDPKDREFLQSEIVSITSVGAISKEEEIMDDTNEARSTVERETTASPIVEKKVISGGKKDINPSEHIASDTENKFESKDVFESLIDNECGTEVSVSRNRTPTEKHVSNTEKPNFKNKTPKQTFNEKFKSPEVETKEGTPVEVDEIEEREILKTPEGKNKRTLNLSSGSKRRKSSRGSEAPKTDMQTLSPSKRVSTLGKRKRIGSQTEGGNSTGSSDDFVPSSHKKVTNKSDTCILGSDMEESDEIIHSVPDISVHLKGRTKTPKTDVKAESSQQQMDDQDQTPRLTRNYIAAKQSVKSVGTDLNVDDTPRRKGLSSAVKGAPEAIRKESVGNKLELEEDRDLDTISTPQKEVLEPKRTRKSIGTPRRKRLSSAVKGAPEPIKEESVDNKVELEEDRDLDTINKPEKQVLGPRRTRKSIGSQVVSKTPVGDRKPGEKLVKTPVSVRKRESLGSVSKKSVTKVQELRVTRKRVLPTDVSDVSDADSEVTFPKLKAGATPDKRVSKRLSTPATQTEKEASKDTPNRRYSLRNK